MSIGSKCSSDFKRLIAPFDGIVTTRNTDVGALINADSSAGLALFVISDTQKLRLNVSIPQNYVPAVKLNTKVADHRARVSRQDLLRRRRGLGARRRRRRAARRACSSSSTTAPAS